MVNGKKKGWKRTKVLGEVAANLMVKGRIGLEEDLCPRRGGR